MIEPVIQRHTGEIDAVIAHVGEIGKPQPARKSSGEGSYGSVPAVLRPDTELSTVLCFSMTWRGGSHDASTGGPNNSKLTPLFSQASPAASAMDMNNRSEPRMPRVEDLKLLDLMGVISWLCIICGVRIRRSAGEHRTRLISADQRL